MIFQNKKTLNMLITLNCDSRCKHCYIKSVDDDTSKDLSKETWMAVFKNFKDNGGQDVCIHGGEPLLYKDLKDLLLYARKIGLATSIITNTFHMDDELIQVLKKTDTYVLCSLDGPEDNYNIFRGENKLHTVITNVDRMLEKGISVHPISVVHNQNIEYLNWIKEFSLKRPIHTVTLSPLQPVGRANQQEDFTISPKQISALVDTMRQYNQEQTHTKFVTQAVYKPENIEDYKRHKSTLLAYNDEILNVTNEGVVLADFDLPNRFDYIVGSVLETKEVDESARLAYKDLLEESYNNGIEALLRGEAINFFEVMQRTSLGK